MPDHQRRLDRVDAELHDDADSGEDLAGLDHDARRGLYLRALEPLGDDPEPGDDLTATLLDSVAADLRDATDEAVAQAPTTAGVRPDAQPELARRIRTHRRTGGGARP
ncbi:MAG: hypothetical protein M3P96_04065 [Actinomycetota bacterium]|nr:hypothetical protein [Actinomycetota bacterium]